MQRIDPFRETGHSRQANPAMLLALAIGIAVGAMLSGGSARSETLGGVADPRATAPITDDLGAPKPVRSVPIPAPSAAAPKAAPVALPAAAPAVAGRYSGDDRYRRCLDEADGTNVAWDACGADLIAREDHRMNEAWKRVYIPGSEAKSQELLEEQRAWLAFRDTSCTLYRSGRFGREGQVLSYPVCRAGIIAERTAALDAYGDPEGR